VRLTIKGQDNAGDPKHFVKDWEVGRSSAWRSSTVILALIQFPLNLILVASSFPVEVIRFFNESNLSSCTMSLGSTEPLTEMSTRNLPEGKGGPARKTDNLTTICELIV
jgi:hypothetical protein